MLCSPYIRAAFFRRMSAMRSPLARNEITVSGHRGCLSWAHGLRLHQRK